MVMKAYNKKGGEKMICEYDLCIFQKENRCTYEGEVTIDMMGNCMSAWRAKIKEDLLKELKKETLEQHIRAREKYHKE